MCPGTFAPALVPGQRDTGTRKFLCPGTKGQRDVPSRGNANLEGPFIYGDHSVSVFHLIYLIYFHFVLQLMRPCTLAMFWLACCIYLLKETVVQCLDWPWSTGSCSHLHPTCAGSDQSTKPSGTIAPCTSWSSSSPFSSNFYWPSYIALASEAWVAGKTLKIITKIWIL